MSASQHEPASDEIGSEDDEELIDPRKSGRVSADCRENTTASQCRPLNHQLATAELVEQSDKPVDLCREGTAPVLLNTLQSGSSDVCELSALSTDTAL